MERRPDHSILKYVLRVKKLEVANCEAISQASIFEAGTNAWLDKMEKEEMEEEEGGYR